MERKREELRVLLVEDNPGDARLIREYVSGGTKEVFRIDHCDDLARAQTHLARTNADVVLLDLGLPDSQGLDTLRSIRKQAPRLPIVVLTGLRSEEMGVDASREGAQDYLTKDTLTPELLTTTLRYAIARQRAQDELRESLERFQLASHATFNAIWDWNLQTDALWWNDNFQMLFGYRAEETEPGIESWEHRIHPEDLDRVKTGIHAAIDSGQDHWLDHYRFRRRDGMYADIEDRGYIARDASGRPERMIGAMQDVTEREQAKTALQESEERFRVAQDMSPDGFTILRPVRDAQERVVDFTWVYENAAIARLNGTDPKAVVGRRLLELFPGHRNSPFLRAYQQVAESGEFYAFEAEYSGESMPTPTWFRIVTVPMGDEIAVLAQDVTERKQAEARLKSQLEELQRWEAIMLDREDRVREIKREVNELCRRVGEDIRYRSEEAQ
jgi:PAS domain S-box-containing protein